MLLLVALVFLILHVIPGDPVNAIVGPAAPPAFKAEIRHQLGLDQPLYVQYVSYITGIFTGNLGTSIVTARPVSAELAEFFPATLELTTAGLILTLAIGIPLGLFSSTRVNSRIDLSTRIYGMTVYAIPVFWVGLVFQLIFGVYLGVLPVFGMGTSPSHVYTGIFVLDSVLSLDPFSLVSDIESLILPAMTMALILSGVISRLTRTYVIGNLNQQYTRAAKARGLKNSTILLNYGFKNALIPLITIIGLQIAILLGGATLVESTFSWPGVGLYLVQRIGLRDYPAIQGAVVLFAILVTLTNLVVDVLYALVDPRVKL
jgi:peptide/nickel transport system permease protein